jgi:hypothetical protein
LRENKEENMNKGIKTVLTVAAVAGVGLLAYKLLSK